MVMERAHPYCPSVWPFSLQYTQFEAGREHGFPAEFYESSTDISTRSFLDMKTNAHVDTGHDMIELDQSNLGGCQG